MEQELFRGLQDEQAYKQLVEMAFDTSWAGTLIADRHGKYLFANKQYEEVVGLSDRVIRTLDSQIMGQNLVREKISTVDLVLEQKREVLLIQSQSYSDRVFLVRGVPCFDTAGEVVYVICHLLDLSALHRYEQRMLQTRQEKKTLYEDYVRVTDQMGTRDEKLVYRSRAMRQVIEQINRVARLDVTVFSGENPAWERNCLQSAFTTRAPAGTAPLSKSIAARSLRRCWNPSSLAMRPEPLPAAAPRARRA